MAGSHDVYYSSLRICRKNPFLDLENLLAIGIGRREETSTSTLVASPKTCDEISLLLLLSLLPSNRVVASIVWIGVRK